MLYHSFQHYTNMCQTQCAECDERALMSERVHLQGLLPGMFGVSHGALQFMAYEELKKLWNEYHNESLNKKLVSVSDHL